ncbi:hypothetical protein [Marinomonas mediterranea]|jgi:hypothetical protein|uniref:Right handed beta helix domain-containing protein n=1 Tax=Marinomonas mediterranea (strain ATCC 700492 / JCM 21426 / NBRC 103028 / MMB-1) TaxID=717774 RepID=F2JWY0_MARM1|nr:hypothetical protein [Marinomonas mediterranea]ADZ92997.1 hypothetical protein Marme_3787 [Marinomonas mediterranea MMB-1]WCN19015.1 hypothetical protein GV053_19200 [Marinomonas mediterranea MMB-1]
MNNVLPSITVLSAMLSSFAFAMEPVDSETSLNMAIKQANRDSSVASIVLKKDAVISLTSPIIYTGKQALSIEGNGAVLNGEKSGTYDEFYDKEEKVTTVRTNDGTLVFKTAADITISDLSVVDSHTRGIVVTVPENAKGKDLHMTLNNVNVKGSSLYGLHLDDNLSELDDGDLGSAIGIKLDIRNSNFINNGTGAIDFDGIRVDERAQGSITATIVNTNIIGNGGDGIELDEAGAGDVNATMNNVAINNNGAYNEKDLDDGFDIDEGDDGDLIVTLNNLQINHNRDEGLDFDEAGNGNIQATINNVFASYIDDEAIKLDEEDAGDINATLSNVSIDHSQDDGIQFTELGKGQIDAALNNVSVTNSKKYGAKIEQWLVEEEATSEEAQGTVSLSNVMLKGNGKGDNTSSHGVTINK